jgi:lipoate-protein ligase A
LALKPRVFISDINDPFLNAAIEKYLFVNLKREEPILFLWKNTPSVFIGRHQNPWMECNMPFLKRRNIPFLRRESGGGTVYHDLGNLNFSFMAFDTFYNKETNFNLILQTLRSFDINAAVSKRNDIQYNGRKFSGSAFRFEKEKSLHHGTLLVDTNITNLLNALKVSPLGINSKGTASVTSRVINLIDVNKKLKVRNIATLLSENFFRYWDVPGVVKQFDHHNINFKKFCDQYLNMLKGWDWQYGKTPFFSIYLKEQCIKLDVKHGKIHFIQGSTADGAEVLNSILCGCPFSEKEFSIRCRDIQNNCIDLIKHKLDLEFWR